MTTEVADASRGGDAAACPGLSAAEEWDDESALRGEIYATERLIPHAAELARAAGSVSLKVPADKLLRRIAAARTRIRAAYATLSRDAGGRRRPSSSEEWLLDNSHIVSEQLREIEEDLPWGYLTKLPRFTRGNMRGYPRVYALCLDYLRHTDARLDPETLVHFVASYQEVAPLAIGELWAIPILLRLGLILTTGAIASGVAEALEHAESAEEKPRRDHVRQATDRVTVANAITSMRTIAAFDWNKFFDRTSLVEGILQRDTDRTYGHSDEGTRDRCRHAVEELAERSHVDERGVANTALEMAETSHRDHPEMPWAAHIAYYLLGEGRRKLERAIRYRPTFDERFQRLILDAPFVSYFGTMAVVCTLSWGVWAFEAHRHARPVLAAALVVLALAPVSELAVALVNALAVMVVPPRVLPKLSLRSGVGPARKTLVVIPSLLENDDVVDDLVERLEVVALANPDRDVHFALLTDLPDSLRPPSEGDDPRVVRARRGIEALNARHAADGHPVFFLLHREPRWNPSQGVFMGWERKRGKLTELNRLLRGEATTSFCDVTAPADLLRSVRYVITLDADTDLPRDAAKKLVGAISHPENGIRRDSNGRIAGGYGIVQPRVRALPRSSRRSRFARITAGPPGIDAYTNTVSDVYQDVFGAGSYVGKAIYDVDAFKEALDGRVPDNRLLSHDLFEGIHARTALASDIEVLDEQPSSYAVVAVRQHRWVRGDFQLLPWLLPRVPMADGTFRKSDLPALGYWKLLDNLRRAFVAPSLVALAVVGWAAGSPGLVTAALLVLLTAPLYGRVAMSLFRAPVNQMTSLEPVIADLRTSAAQICVNAVFLFDQAIMVADAILRTTYRVAVSKRNLLEWVTAGQAERRLAGKIPRRIWIASCLAVAVLGCIVAFARGSVPFAAPWLVCWAATPFWAAWLSRPAPRRIAAELSDADRSYLRRTALRTWRFFETFVTDRDHFLPPDNVQEDPSGVVAHRTSPTNIGVYILSVVAARDLGFITIREVIDRLTATFATLARLEKREGHILNWYDTATLVPLEPRYVSTVDSGNLAAYLWAIREACHDLWHTPIVGPEALQSANASFELAIEHRDRLAGSEIALRERLERAETEHGSTAWKTLRSLDDVANALEEVRAHSTGDTGAEHPPDAYWLERTSLGVSQAAVELRDLFPWADALARAPRALAADPFSQQWTAFTDEIAEVNSIAALLDAASKLLVLLDAVEQCAGSAPNDSAEVAETRSYLVALREGVVKSVTACEAVRDRLERVAEQSAAIADAMNFAFLFDEDRLLFSIGYNAQAERRDSSHYDLLASEARTASFVAIAKGDVREKHWFRLGRSLAALPDGRALWSWSGSIFEYLMPLLVMMDGDETLLHETYASVVEAQRRYGAKHGVPWGISESLFNLMDLSLTYQYRAFGTPGLGLKTGLADDLVVAPYATALAAMVRADLAVRNLKTLEAEGAVGRFGFYESIDYTKERVPAGRRSVVVRAFMAHHQGMTLVAIDNALENGPMQRRFHSDPRVRATELLLEERAPVTTPLAELRPAPVAEPGTYELEPDIIEHEGLERRLPCRVHLLGQGEVSTVMTSLGTGVTQWHGLDLNRFREDVSLRSGGIFVYVRDLRTGQTWSAGYEPTRKAPDAYDAVFSSHQVEIRRRDGDVETVLTVVVSPEAPAEVRRITLTNHGTARRDLEVTTYTEVALATRNSDRAHRAFSALFVETEAVPEREAMLAHRRSRGPDEPEVWMAQTLTPEDGTWTDVDYDGSRAAFIGRGRDVTRPASLISSAKLSRSAGAVLDPGIALRRTLSLRAGKSARVALTTMLASDRLAVERLLEQYSDAAAIERTFDLARVDTRVELRHLGLSTEEGALFQRLVAALVFANPRLRAGGGLRIDGARGRGALFALGLSGDLPIAVLRMDDAEFSGLASELLQAHEFLRSRGLPFDVVLLNEEPSGYFHPREDQARDIVQTSIAHASLDKSGGITIRRADQISDADRAALLRAAHVVLAASKGSLASQLQNASEPFSVPDPFTPPRQAVTEAPVELRPQHLQFDNGIGGFDEDSGEYVMRIAPGVRPGAPWCNVVANEGFGFVVSESGASFTWSRNSQSHRLTPWSNDTVSDPTGETFYVRDEEDGTVWSLTPSPAGGSASYVVRHGFGYTTFEHERRGLAQTLTMFVDRSRSAKLFRIAIVNRSSHPRTLRVLGAVEWVLGGARDRACLSVATEWERDVTGVFAMNHLSSHWNRCAFFRATLPVTSYTADRTELYGRSGSQERPAALRRVALSGRTGAGLDPCAALQVPLELAPGARIEFAFVLGDGADRREAQTLAAEFGDIASVESSFESTRTHWKDLLESVTVKTPDRAFDRLLNGWLLYQVSSCRLFARTSFYQPSGAYGFRDQLQDVLALLHARPDLAREHLLRAAARQFLEGDVQHWWHPDTGEGIRTRCSDDMLWLPFAAAEYVRTTGDAGVLDEMVPFLDDKPLAPNERDSFGRPGHSTESASLYEHCVRAIRVGLTAGPHGLPKMRAGDWNDGMNRVGGGDGGESVWLGWFLARTLTDFGACAIARGNAGLAADWRNEVERLARAVHEAGWDGHWYLRGYFDDGSTLGSSHDEDCRIDAIAQSWAVISGIADRPRAVRALDSADDLLVDHNRRLMSLLWPPFRNPEHDPGYIRAYPPGVRENGGQYTHGVLWSVLAHAQLGHAERAFELFTMLNPIHHGSREYVSRYAVEPYVVAGDVCAGGKQAGRGGWTWYTGAAGWMYRIGLESILGIRREGKSLVIAPCVPEHFSRYEVTYRFGAAVYHITVETTDTGHPSKRRLLVDGKDVSSAGRVPLVDDGKRHEVLARVNSVPSAPERRFAPVRQPAAERQPVAVASAQCDDRRE